MQWKGDFSEEDEIRLGGKCTPWLYLAFDFRAATMEKVTKMGELKVKRLWHHWQEHFTWLREECFRDVSTKKNINK